jgi:hypothetical protein
LLVHEDLIPFRRHERFLMHRVARVFNIIPRVVVVVDILPQYDLIQGGPVAVQPDLGFGQMVVIDQCHA